MSKIISGVYKITNSITGKFYIGSSSHIFKRWKSHLQRFKNPSDKEYNKKLYVDMRKYGSKNFIFEIITICNPTDLIKLENMFIKKMDAYNKGYNENHIGEHHGRSMLTELDVITIRNRYANHESYKTVYNDYRDKISESGFHKIWNGYNWKHVSMNVYTDENKYFHSHNTGLSGEYNPRSLLTENDVKYIRTSKKEGKDKNEIFNQYKNKISKGYFSNIWYGYNWPNIKV